MEKVFLFWFTAPFPRRKTLNAYRLSTLNVKICQLINKFNCSSPLAIQLFGKHYWPSDKFIRFGAEIGGQPNEIGHVIRKNKNHSLVKLL